MPRHTGTRIVLVTCASRAQARTIAKAIVAKRLAACVNILSAPVESIYRWNGMVETAKEFLLIVKTTAKRLKELERTVLALHSYEVPEFLVLEAPVGSPAYLQWITGNT